MKHALSSDDRRFRAEFEAGRFPPDRFDHRAHVRLAYVYLAEHDTDEAVTLLRSALRSWLRHHRVDPAKYHETITRAWILAVRHFMETSAGAASAAAFIDAHPLLLDRKIMLTHYSADLLFSNEARARFVEPDLDEIPRHPG